MKILNLMILARPKSSLFLFICYLCLLVLSCNRNEPEVIRGETMGTTYAVKYHGPGIDKGKLRQQIEKTLAKINGAMSTYDQESNISRVNRAPANQWVKISAELSLILQASLVLAKATDGYFDVTVGRLVNLWGFGPDGRATQVPSENELQAALNTTGYERLTLDARGLQVKKDKEKVFIDLSAIAKGYAVDMVAELLNVKGIAHYMVEIGGEVKTQGRNKKKSWRIGIEKPDESARQVQRVIEMKNMAIASSGNYRNFYVIENNKFSHTIDPKTGRPTKSIIAAVTIIHSSCMMADAYATALMAMPTKKAFNWAKQNRVAALFLLFDKEGKVIEKTSPEMNNYLDLERAKK